MAIWIIRFLIFLSLVVSVYMIVLTLERCRSEKRYGFVYCVAALFFYTLGYFIEMTTANLGGGIIAVKVMYIGACFMSPFFFFFVADYCETSLPKKLYTIPVLIVPLFIFFLVATFDRHTLFYSAYSFDPSNPIMGMEITPGPFYMLGAFYPLICIALSSVILVRSIVTQSKGRRFGLILLLIACLAPMLAQVVYVIISYFFKSALAGINLTAFTMVVSNLILYFTVVRNDMFDLAPKAYSITLDLIRDSFVVLDRGLSYVGSNKKAQELFPALRELHKGASIAGLENWPEELAMKNSSAEVRETDFTLPHQRGKNYSGWINRVTSDSGAVLGWVVMIQDVTETVSLIRDIQARRDEIAAMRDNLKEGLFFMDREYRIQGEYSKALESVLSGTRLEGKRFTELLGRSFKPKDVETIGDYFTMIIDGSVDSEMLEDMNPLQEFSYTSMETGEQKTLRGFFAPVARGTGEIFVLVTLEDITAEAALKKQLAEEEGRRQEEMRNLFEVMQVDQKVFRDFLEDTDYEFSRINGMIRDKKLSNRQFLVNMYQSVHAVKSNALIVGLSSYGEKLHALETEIKQLREKEEEPSFEAILHLTLELEKRMKDREKFPEIIKRIRDFSSSAAAGKSKKDEEVFLEALETASRRVAEDTGKKVSFKAPSFDKETLKGRRRVMKEILTQLVRNAVYHGIETPEERTAAGKDETGVITLSAVLEGGLVRMTLSDDGRGLDFDRIAARAETQGLLKDPHSKNDRKFLLGLIFSPGFSTSETENIHAGRGIGLNLVKDRLQEVQGKIQIRSEKGKGLSYDIQIPLAG